jgi:hypothetical protein
MRRSCGRQVRQSGRVSDEDLEAEYWCRNGTARCPASGLRLSRGCRRVHSLKLSEKQRTASCPLKADRQLKAIVLTRPWIAFISKSYLNVYKDAMGRGTTGRDSLNNPDNYRDLLETGETATDSAGYVSAIGPGRRDGDAADGHKSPRERGAELAHYDSSPRHRMCTASGTRASNHAAARRGPALGATVVIATLADRAQGL